MKKPLHGYTENRMHISSYGRLMGVLVALLVLTGITVAASYVDLGALNVWVALLIASTKASLVLLFFMHIGIEGRLIVVSFLGTVLFLAVMIGFTFWDVAFRGKVGV
ncbi:hypothetical protein DSLASN_22100 [Desulfoluna limicola]|uniref:Cytochrome-c oxidase n=1 Tax=Desulfoluna limicola TaxID=2810562 RepID=A0ABM7PH94_9BACT|nr:cytochrome C oxidase subunit IV family protein [Desulfoluna limicola]BCS96578.1 hypothetical protein DSLASN_22100 [Desulfoluna limicola]